MFICNLHIIKIILPNFSILNIHNTNTQAEKAENKLENSEITFIQKSGGGLFLYTTLYFIPVNTSPATMVSNFAASDKNVAQIFLDM